MKYVFKSVSVALATMGLLTSCLKEVNTAFAPGEIPAVTERVNGVMVVNTRYGRLYDKKLDSNESGQCLVVDFTYNSENPGAMDAESNGYYTVNVARQERVNQQAIQPGKVDMDHLLAGELPLAYALSPLPETQAYFDLIGNHLFLPSFYVAKGNPQVQWQLSFNPDEMPSETDGRRVYPVCLRAVAQGRQEAGAADEVRFALNAFDLTPWLASLQAQGEPVGRGLFLAIRYIQGINAADSTQFSWAVTDPLQIK